MQATFWVAITAEKRYGSWNQKKTELRKAKPTKQGPNTAAVKITVEIPDAYFETPELSAKIVVPADAVNRPVITPTVEHNIGAAISKQLGMKVHVSSEPELPTPIKGKSK